MAFGFGKMRSIETAQSQAGFTLLELTISMAILVVVSGLTFVVTQSTTSAVALSEAKELSQASVRNALTDMTNELSLGSKKTNAGLIPALAALKVVSTSEVLFQIPDGTSGTTYSEPITYKFVNEDTNGNAILDSGEDKDNDGVLTRHILRTQGDTQRVMGTANDISAVRFSLNAPTNDMLTITLTATKAVNDRRRNLITSTATSTVYLSN